MRIGDELFYASGVAFKDIDLDSGLILEHFSTRIVCYYIEPAEKCSDLGCGFASGLLLVSCIDALARFQYDVNVGVKERFTRFAREKLLSFSENDISERFYDEIRNGLVHESRLKKGAQFSFEIPTTVEINNDMLIVNPKMLADEVRTALISYISLLNKDQCLRENLINLLKEDHRLDL